MGQSDIIIKPIRAEYEQFHAMYNHFAETDNPLLRTVLSHMVQRSGKQMRPILSLLFAKLHGGITKDSYSVAIAIELLHNASLLHDDVVDESLMRRGQKSINAEFGNKVSVLAGDYLLSTSSAFIAETGNAEMARVMSRIGQELSDGELYQLSQSQEIDLSEDTYFKIISKKTACLFGACTQLGALSAGATAEEAENARKFGESIGICFQIRDDIFDYFDDAQIGKPTGNDMREGKLTLPILYAIRQAATDSVMKQIELLKQGKLDDDGIRNLILFAIDNGGIEYAERRMKEYCEHAQSLLPPTADEELQQAILAHMEMVVGRTY